MHACATVICSWVRKVLSSPKACKSSGALQDVIESALQDVIKSTALAAGVSRASILQDADRRGFLLQLDIILQSISLPQIYTRILCSDRQTLTYIKS